jgi:hypothetical protein
MSEERKDAPDLDWTMSDYVVSDSNGRILVAGWVPSHMIDSHPVKDGQSIIRDKGHPETHYVSEGAVHERPVNPTTLVGMKLLNVPNPSSVTIAGEGPHQVTDGEADLEFTQPGTYKVVVSSWPALDAVFEVTQP